jgi:hypothetical protein
MPSQPVDCAAVRIVFFGRLSPLAQAHASTKPDQKVHPQAAKTSLERVAASMFVLFRILSVGCFLLLYQNPSAATQLLARSETTYANAFQKPHKPSTS